MLALGTIFQDKYEIRESLGEGGMGIVYKVWQPEAKRTIALKVLHSVHLYDDENVKRFRREAKVLSRLQHKNIVTFYHYGLTEDFVPYVALEYLRGKNLGQVLEEGPMDARRAIRIMRQVCDALSFAHELGVIHRDLKPSNIVLIDTPEPDFVKVVDFGLARLGEKSSLSTAKLTKTGLLIGSLHYMSPEQARGQPVDARSDIYACGCVLFEMLTGQKAFNADNPVGLLYKQCNEPLPSFSVTPAGEHCPPKVQQLCTKATSKDPDNRYQSMAEMISDLDAIANDTGLFLAADFVEPEVKKAIVQSPGVKNKIGIKRSQVAFLSIALLLCLLPFFDPVRQMIVALPLLKNQIQPAATLTRTGIITSLDHGEKKQIKVYLRCGNELLKLHSDGMIPIRSTDAHIGAIWSATFSPSVDDKTSGKLTAFKSLGNNGEIVEATNVVTNLFSSVSNNLDTLNSFDINFLQRICAGKPASEIMTSGYALDKINELFGKDLIERARTKMESKVYGISSMDPDDDLDSYPTPKADPGMDGIAILKSDPEFAQVLVDTKFFYKKPFGFERFDLKFSDDTWKITNVEKLPTNESWNEFIELSHAKNAANEKPPLELALHNLESGRVDLATANLQNALMIEPQNVRVMKLLAECNLKRYDLDKCLQLCELISKSDSPEKNWAAVTDGRVILSSENPAAALSSLNKLAVKLLSAELKLQFYILRATALHRMDKDTAALEDLDEALKLDSRNLDALMLKAEGLVGHGNYKDAFPVIDFILKNQLNDEQRVRVLACRGNAYFGEHDNARALSDFSSAVEISAKWTNDEWVRESLRKAHLGPSRMTVMFRADTLLRLRDYVLIQRGRLYLAKGEFRKALADFNVLGSENAMKLIGPFYRAKTLSKMKDWQSAEGEISTCLGSLHHGREGETLVADTILLLALCQAKSGDINDARINYQYACQNSKTTWWFNDLGDMIAADEQHRYDESLKKEVEAAIESSKN